LPAATYAEPALPQVIGGAPPPPPKVVFDQDSADLTPRVAQMIARAASLKKINCYIKVEVFGFHDKSTATTYEDGLEERRAKVVAMQLLADGIPAAEIKTQSYFRGRNVRGDALPNDPDAHCGIIEIALY